jgi:hypothetical protein
MKVSVGVKIFSVVVILLVLVGSAAWINARKAESVQSIIVDMRDTYVPAYGSLARASLYSVDEGLFARRMVIAKLLSPTTRTATRS